jgi:hypothetical protein
VALLEAWQHHSNTNAEKAHELEHAQIAILIAGVLAAATLLLGLFAQYLD